MPIDVSQYHWVEVELVGTISIFNNTHNQDDAYKDVGPSYDWFVPISTLTKGYVAHSRGAPTFFKCLFSKIRFKFPFNNFEEGGIEQLGICPLSTTSGNKGFYLCALILI